MLPMVDVTVTKDTNITYLLCVFFFPNSSSNGLGRGQEACIVPAGWVARGRRDGYLLVKPWG